MTNTCAPIIIPTLCRDEHLKKCITSLADNKLALQTELYIGLDYPPSDKYLDGWKRIKEYVPTITGFKKVVLLEADHNLTAQGNIEFLKAHIRKLGYDSYVFTEDDNTFSPNFLEYANWGLKEFENDNSIFAVVGFKRVNVDFLKNNVYKYPRYVAWGFATWFKKSDKMNEFKDFGRLEQLVKSWPIRTIFTKRIYTAATVLRMLKTHYILEDTLPSLLPPEEMYCIYPKISMVRNIGFDGSGLHGGNNKEMAVRYSSIIIDDRPDFSPIIEGPLYVEELKKAYDEAYKKHFRFKRWVVDTVAFLSYRLTGRIISVR